MFRCLPPGLGSVGRRSSSTASPSARIFADMAYRRLATTLTTMALNAHQLSEDEARDERRRPICVAFGARLATVDAIDRFRGLVKIYPHQREGKVDIPGYREMLVYIFHL